MNLGFDKEQFLYGVKNFGKWISFHKKYVSVDNKSESWFKDLSVLEKYLKEVYLSNCSVSDIFPKLYDEKIFELKDNQVFVFGSNLDGFHGGGAAGVASFGVGKSWRNMDYVSKPNGWKGLWTVKGCAEGFQEGTKGKSYAIPTVVHAGQPRSISIGDIKENVIRFYGYCESHPEYEFLVAYGVDKNLNGYSTEEMASIFACDHIPSNVVFQRDFAEYILDKISVNDFKF